ncbi:MAG: hypothetical protein RIT45_284 [Pseudomonadota bacterium]
MAVKLVGRTDGLGAGDRAGLERLFRYHTPVDRLVGDTLGRHMAALSSRLRRQIGVLLDRRGEVTHVIVGDDTKLELPDVGRLRASKGRLRGVRLVHTHLKGEGLTDDDLTDLARLGLDVVVAVTLDGDLPNQLHVGHIVPTRPGEVVRDVRPHVTLDPIAWPGAEFDADALIRDLETQLARAVPDVQMVDARERALIIHVGTESQAEADDRLDELAELCRTARVEVLGRVVQRRAVDPKTVLGSGRLESVVLEAMQQDASLLVFDRELSPAQMRSVARATEMKILDRTQLILDIFAGRARSRDGQIEVELAQLRYALPRLGSRDDAMSRLTGGIGGVGPGETKLEIDKRRARDRMHRLEQELQRLRRSRDLRRDRRRRSEVPTVALCGYTNVGKSSLLNALSKSDIFTENLLFATLDPTSRRIRRAGGSELIITDTVGFIRDLPKELMGAFHATLEEARDADLIVVVGDASHPHLESQLQSVDRILREQDLGEMPRMLVLNKSDAVHDLATVRELCERRDAALVSAANRDGLPELLERLAETALLARDQPSRRREPGPSTWSPLDD